MAEDDMVGWHHQLNGYESEQILGADVHTCVCQARRLCSLSGSAQQLSREREEDGEAGVYRASTAGQVGAFCGGVSSLDTLRV